MRKKNVLLVNWGTETAEYPLCEAVKLNKYDLYLAATEETPRVISKIFPVGHLIHTNPYDCSQLIEDVITFTKKSKFTFDIVTTFFEMNVYQAAVLANYLGCKRYLPSEIALRTSVNKYLMRETIKRAGLAQPNFLRFNEKQLKKAFKFYRQLSSGAVIKPVHSGHSYGTRYVKKGLSLTSFKKLYRRARRDLSLHYDEWMDYENPNIIKNFLIEEYIDGLVISCDGVVSSPGKITFIGSAEFEISKPPEMQQIGHITPIASLDKKQIKKCRNYVRRVVKEIGLQYCGFHCEMRWNNRNPLLLEISGRLPGGGLLPSHQAVSKFNIFDQFFSVFEGQAKKNYKRNVKVAKSELLISGFTKQKGVFVQVHPPKIQGKKYLIQINTREGGEYLSPNSNPFKIGEWVYSLQLKSDKLSPIQLKEEGQRIKRGIVIELRRDLQFIILVLFQVKLKKIIRVLKRMLGRFL